MKLSSPEYQFGMCKTANNLLVINLAKVDLSSERIIKQKFYFKADGSTSGYMKHFNNLTDQQMSDLLK